MHPLIPYFERPVIHIPIPGPWGDTINIHGFGVLVAIGVWLGSKLTMDKCRRDGLEPELINRFLTWIIVGILVGGHLGHALFYEPAYFLEHPLELFYVFNGLSSYGGFIGCTIAALIYFRLERKSFWEYGDTLAYGFTLGWFFGRMGCFVAHDHIGNETNFWLAVQGVCPGHEGNAAYACHDVGLYEGLYAGLVLLPLFLFLDRKPRFPGFFIGMFCLLYGPIRFVLDAARNPLVDTRYLGLTPAQYGSILISLLGLGILWVRRGYPPIRPIATQAPQTEPAPESST